MAPKTATPKTTTPKARTAGRNAARTAQRQKVRAARQDFYRTALAVLSLIVRHMSERDPLLQFRIRQAAALRIVSEIDCR